MENLKNLSPFGKSAVALDHDFLELERLSGQISRIELESDTDLERAQLLLTKFSEVGQKMADKMQDFARTLGEIRSRSDNAAQVVAERSIQLQERRSLYTQGSQKYQTLIERVQQASGVIVKFSRPSYEVFSDEDKNHLRKQMSDLDSLLLPLILEARELKEYAGQYKMKALERSAHSIGQSLEASMRKVTQALAEVIEVQSSQLQ